MESSPTNPNHITPALYKWAESLIDRSNDTRLSIVSYEEAKDILNPGITKYEARPLSPEAVFAISSAAIGDTEFSKFVQDLQTARLDSQSPGTLLRLINGRLKVPKQGVLLTTDHERILDIAVARNALYCAIGDENIASQSGIIINEATTLLKYDEAWIVDYLRMTGHVYLTRPKSKSAESFGLTETESEKFNKRMLYKLLHDVHDLGKENKSILMAAAVTGSTAKRIMRGEQLVGFELPEVPAVTTEVVSKFFRLAVPISMYLPNIKDNRQWYSIRQISSIFHQEQLDEVVEDLGAAMAEMSSLEVFYKGNIVNLGRAAVANA